MRCVLCLCDYMSEQASRSHLTTSLVNLLFNKIIILNHAAERSNLAKVNEMFDIVCEGIRFTASSLNLIIIVADGIKK